MCPKKRGWRWGVETGAQMWERVSVGWSIRGVTGLIITPRKVRIRGEM